MSSLGEELPKEMKRVRDELLPEYDAIGPNGAFAAMMMRRALDHATLALAEGDVVQMMLAYEELKEFKL